MSNNRIQFCYTTKVLLSRVVRAFVFRTRFLFSQLLHDFIFSIQILTIRLNYKLQWHEGRMAVNESADWNGGEINISPDNIDVREAVIDNDDTSSVI